MTVFELVQKLMEYDPDTRVLVAGENFEEKGLTDPVVKYYDEDAGPQVFVAIG